MPLRARWEMSPGASAVEVTICITSATFQKMVPSSFNLTLSLVRTSFWKNIFCARRSIIFTMTLGTGSCSTGDV
eukprot:Skav223260  [mRNA]  locus=scaffold1037:186295:191552:+ [translate_table: standard]